AQSRFTRLIIQPAPDVVTCVLMLFRGVQGSELANWSDAAERACDDVHFWRDVVRVDLNAALNDALFRVLEWGGMEVIG
ncbi:hypothetical protein PENSPDRAFT_583145, partial [Peniophora sp. CONT]